LYYFVHYQRYDSLREFVDSSIQAVSSPVFCVALIGVVLALIVPGRNVTRAAAITLIFYVALTAYLSTDAAAQSLVDQLEMTRLMPFQRFLMLFLAAVGAYDVSRWLTGFTRAGARLATDIALAGLSVLVLILYVISPPDFIPQGDRGLYEIPSTVRPAMADLEAAVKLAEDEAAPGTALLVLGTDLSNPRDLTWHDGLWSPMWSDRPFFYDDWLWYWQQKHFGDYDPEIEHAYPRDDSTLNQEYLERHGIGAVVVTGEAREAAAASPILELVREGSHDVYVVREPTTIVTFDNQNAAETDYGNEAITANGDGTGGTATIRRNWFPRWSATVDGEDVSITETDDGYMTVPIPEGEVSVDLTYVVDRWDWLARLMSLAGFVAVAFMFFPRRWRKMEGTGRPAT
jgi:hypothetical protein